MSNTSMTGGYVLEKHSDSCYLLRMRIFCDKVFKIVIRKDSNVDIFSTNQLGESPTLLGVFSQSSFMNVDSPANEVIEVFHGNGRDMLAVHYAVNGLVCAGPFRDLCDGGPFKP